MPLYEYECPTCGTFELIRKFSDAPVVACPTCGREVVKLQSAPAFQFKGTGWYVTDYARKGKGTDSSTETKGGDKAKASESSGSESKGSGSESKASGAEATSSSESKSSGSESKSSGSESKGAATTTTSSSSKGGST